MGFITVIISPIHSSRFFFFNDTATTEIYTLSLHDALPICRERAFRDAGPRDLAQRSGVPAELRARSRDQGTRSEEHTSELQSLTNLVCRLLLEKKNRNGWLASGRSLDRYGLM